MTQHLPQLPERIGKYEVRARLGAGSTATVYRAVDPFNQREVAIKLLHAEVLQDQERGKQYQRMLQNEASLAGRLQHPHIVQILDAVIEAAASYIVMEYVPGTTLEPYTRADRLLPVAKVVEIIFKCSRALDYAYSQGVIHRDIKPANILLLQAAESVDAAANADIKLSDFGAALMPQSEHTQVQGVGSPAYMSPQQVQEQPLDQQTDIYSLGVVMYQLLTGQLPFKASNNAVMLQQILQSTPVAPSSLRPEIPAAVDEIVRKAMARDTTARYASWSEFAQALAQVFRHQRQSAAQPAAPQFPDSEKFETLRALSFFQTFSAVEIWEVVRLARWQEVAAETLIMRDGEAGDSCCFLVSGELDVRKQGQLLGRLKAGACFGEMALIASGFEPGLNTEHIQPAATQRTADVISCSTATLISIPRSALMQASEACRLHFYQAFLRVLSERLVTANIRLMNV